MTTSNIAQNNKKSSPSHNNSSTMTPYPTALLIDDKFRQQARTSWCEPVVRGDLKLGPGDIQEAIASYINTNAVVPDAVMINHKNERYADEAGDIPVVISPGTMLWEIELVNPVGASKKVKVLPVPELSPPALPPEPPQVPPASPKPVAKLVTPIKPLTGSFATPQKHPGGRPRAALPEEEIVQMHFDYGISGRRITEMLFDRGIDVDHSTISRLINRHKKRLL